jgi:hypothetical protein
MRACVYSAWRSDAAVLFRCPDGDHVPGMRMVWNSFPLRPLGGKPLFRLPDAIAMSGANLPRRQTSIEVRDDSGPVLVVTVTFV